MSDALTGAVREGRAAEDYWGYLETLIDHLENLADPIKQQICAERTLQQSTVWRTPPVFDVSKLDNKDKGEWAKVLRICEEDEKMYNRAKVVSPFAGQNIFIMHRSLYGCKLEGEAFDNAMRTLLERDGLGEEFGYFVVVMPDIDPDKISIIHADRS